MKGRVAAAALVGAAGLLCLAGCSLQSTVSGKARAGSVSSGSFEKQYVSDPLRVTVKAVPTTIDTAGNVSLDIRADLPAGWSLQGPKIGSELGKFTVTDRLERPSKNLAGDRVEYESIYRLEPFLPGKYQIPSIPVRATKGSITKEVTTAPVSVEVTSLIPKGAKRPLKLKSLAGPVVVPSTIPEIFAGAVTLLAVVAATLFLLLGRFRRRRREKTDSIPPWVRATRELDYLVSLDLPGKERHREFYDRISMLVRKYIEEMFDLNAPELTTEEFLYQLRDSPSLGRHRRFLGDFLSHCDMVKFAAYLPAQDEIHRAVRSCRAFIESTSRDYSGRAESESK